MNQQALTPELIFNAVAIGIGATVAMDLWAALLKRLLNVIPLDYALIGRWVLHMTKGVFRHESIMLAAPVKMESAFGWLVHYVTGIVFAIVFTAFTGEGWLQKPMFIAALAFGALTVAFPYFLVQPCLGLGIAARKTPKPSIARVRSLITHLVFGLGLYISALINPYSSITAGL